MKLKIMCAFMKCKRFTIGIRREKRFAILLASVQSVVFLGGERG